MLYVTSLTAALTTVAGSPEWNLDGVFYSALTMPCSSFADVHDKVYAAVERDVPSPSVEALTGGSAYRTTIRTSAKAFALQLPFYTSKPLYVWLGQCVTALGGSSVRAPYLVSAISFALIGLVLPLLCVAAGAARTDALIASALAVWLPSLRELGALASPDALATALTMCAAVVSLSHPRLTFLPLTGAVLARPDAVILAGGLLAALWTRQQTRLPTREIVFASVLVVVVAFLVPRLSASYGWQTVMRHTFLERVLDDATATRGLRPKDYLTSLVRGLRGEMTNHAAGFIPYLVVALLSGGLYVKNGCIKSQRPAAMLLAGIWCATLIRFLFMPILADRFFAPAYMCTIAMGCALIASREPGLIEDSPTFRASRSA